MPKIVEESKKAKNTKKLTSILIDPDILKKGQNWLRRNDNLSLSIYVERHLAILISSRGKDLPPERKKRIRKRRGQK